MTQIMLSGAQEISGLSLARTVQGLAMWQTPDAINSGHAIWLEVFITISAIALVAMAVVVVALGVVALKAKKAIEAEFKQIKGMVMPLIEKSHVLVTDLTPEIKLITTKVHDITTKVDVITAHIEEIAGVAKDKVHEFAPTISAANTTFYQANETAQEINQKTRQQVGRVNGMITSTLDATASLGRAIQHGINMPGRELAGLVNGAKTTIESFLKSSRRSGSAKPRSAVEWPTGFRDGTASATVRPPTSAGVAEAPLTANERKTGL